MKITKIVDTPEGKFVFECELNGDQHRFIFETGLGYLVSIGAINLKSIAERNDVDADVSIPATTDEPLLH